MWTCIHTWKRSSINTLWCLFGCSIGDLGTIYFFQNSQYEISTKEVMLLAMLNGLITSFTIEVIVLLKSMSVKNAVKTAFGMSIVSMISMEIAMNYTDFILNGAAIINLKSLPLVLLAGFIVPLPYNYWKLKTTGISCH